MSRFHVAVIGAGSFGRHHVRHLAQHPAVAELSVVDADWARAREVAAANGATSVTSCDGLLLDAAVITVPTESHAPVAIPLLERGVACFVEKPIAGTVSEAKAMLAAAERTGATLQVGHIERFSPAFETLQQACGRPAYISARRHNPPRPVPPTADVVLDLMIHDIDLTLALVGAPVERVDAFAPDGTGHECAIATLVFADGTRADISASRLAPQVERVFDVYSAAGVTQADLAQKSVRQCTASTLPVDTARDSLGTELHEFLEAVAGRQTPRVDGRAAHDALLVAAQVQRALTPALKLSA